MEEKEKDEKVFTGTIDEKSLNFFTVDRKRDNPIVTYPIINIGLGRYVGIPAIRFISTMIADGWKLESVEYETTKGSD